MNMYIQLLGISSPVPPDREQDFRRCMRTLLSSFIDARPMTLGQLDPLPFSGDPCIAYRAAVRRLGDLDALDARLRRELRARLRE